MLRKLEWDEPLCGGYVGLSNKRTPRRNHLIVKLTPLSWTAAITYFDLVGLLEYQAIAKHPIGLHPHEWFCYIAIERQRDYLACQQLKWQIHCLTSVSV